MKNLLTALNGVMKAAGYVQKGGKNAHFGYKYATEADLLSVVRPAMIENGLLLIGPQVEGDERLDEHGNTYVTLCWQLAHVSGEVWPEKLRIIGCGNDKSNKTQTIGDKGVYKAYTGAVKYMLFKLLQVATGDDPEVDVAHDYAPEQGGPAAEKPKLATPAQTKDIGEQVARVGWGVEAFKAWTKSNARGVAKRTELTVDEADALLEHLGGLPDAEAA